MAKNVKIDLKGLKRFAKVVASDLRHQTNGPVKQVLTQWAARYRAFLRTRFVKFSGGGGNWPKLKSKRKRGSISSAAILRDTGTMFAAFQPAFVNKPGQLEKRIKFGVRVGYGGPGRHKGGSVTIADIASFHQEGKGFLPKRETIVPPDSQLIQKMLGDMGRGLRKLESQTDVV